MTRARSRKAAPARRARRTTKEPVALIEETASKLRSEARRLLGVVGRVEYDPIRKAFSASNLPWLPLCALCGLAAIDIIPMVLVQLDRPEIARSVGSEWLGMVGVIRIAAAALGAGLVLFALANNEHKGKRELYVFLAGGLTAITLGASSVASSKGVFVAAAGAAIASGAAGVIHLPLLMDFYRPEVRVRAFSLRTAAIFGAMSVASVLAAAAHGVFSWRSAFLVASAVSCAVLLLARRIVDPGEARWDGVPIARVVEESVGRRGKHVGALSADETAMSTAERFRRITAISSSRSLLLIGVAFGMFLVPLQSYLLLLLRDRWLISPAARLWLYAVLCASGAIGAAVFGRRAEVLLRAAPAEFVRLLARSGTLAGVGLLLAAPMPVIGPAMICLGIAFAGFAAMISGAGVLLLTLAPPRLRAHAAGVLTLATFAGTEIGRQLMGMVGGRFGAGWGIAVAAVVAFAVADATRRSAVEVDGDLDRVATGVLEEETLRTLVSHGTRLPLLACRHIDFAYEQIQVLFDVDFTVDDGEMVALLGTNGAGKSTLLRVISGIGLPRRGSVHFRGADITFLEADRRVKVGISQVPGGRAVFGPMTVVENLRVFGSTLGRDKHAMASRLDSVFDVFPRLAERRNQLASTLSGGEQQMLGLAKALILEPRLLLIDELSLGLAPIIVGELLEMVRRINATGTAVVLVEQSVNIALSLVQHAYFMEKGEIRFDGRAQELLRRPDLLRSVFLKGASAALTRTRR